MPNRLPALALIAACLCGPGQSQTLNDVRDAVRFAATEARYPVFVTALADFAEDGELSGGRLDIDGKPGTRLSIMTLPWRRDVALVDGFPDLHLETTVGYAAARIDVPDLWSGGLPGLETRVLARYRAFSADVGVGPSLELGGGFVAQPLVHGGLSYVDNDADYSGPGAALTAAITDGVMFNWNGTYGSYGGSLALRQRTWQLGAVEVRPLLRYDVRHTDGIDVDEAALDADVTARWMTARVDFAGPMGVRLADRPLRWMADLGYRRLLSETGDVVGFDDYFEIGVGLGWEARDVLPALSELQLGATLLVGEDVFGWSLGLSVQF